MKGMSTIQGGGKSGESGKRHGSIGASGSCGHKAGKVASGGGKSQATGKHVGSIKAS